MMPSLDAQLSLPFGVRRIPITELGCSAGVGAVGLAAERLTAMVGSVLVLSVELSSHGVKVAEPSMTDMVANLLFGDAAAGAVLSTEKPGTGPQVLASQSTLVFLGRRIRGISTCACID
jgi:alkylresorcinol/alkylpyrone synthase